MLTVQDKELEDYIQSVISGDIEPDTHGEAVHMSQQMPLDMPELFEGAGY